MNEYDTNENDGENRSGRGRRGRGRGRGPSIDGPPPFVRAMAGHRSRGGPHFDAPWGRFPMGGPGGRSGGRGRGRRARGDVRAAVLALLAEEPMHGYQIIQELAERTDGAWRVSPGSIYPTLQVLEDVGLVRAEKSEGKRVFHLTNEGREAVEASGDRKPWEEVVEELDDGRVALRDELGNVAAATLQVGSAGTDTQIAAAKKVLADARRQLYLLLAEVADETPTPETPGADDDDAGAR